MDSQVQGVIALVRAALTGERQTLPADFDLENVYEPIVHHNIAVMALEGAALCGLDKKLPVMQKLFARAYRSIGQVQAQDKAARALFEAFEHAGIEFMPVKGALLRGLYPKREYRSMSDMDVLIRLEQYDQIKEILLEHGFEAGTENDHELPWKSKALYLELHKHLVPELEQDFYRFYKTGWQLAQRSETSRCFMSDEDHFVFVFIHFAKHYRDGGVGIRQATDLWLMRQSAPQMDEAYIQKELARADLLEFYRNTMHMLRVWFEDAAENGITELMTNMIFESGAFGKARQRMIAAGARLAGGEKVSGSIKYKNVLQRLFLDPKEMQFRYPVLKKWPVLLPAMWLWRIFLIALKDRKKIRKAQKRFLLLDQDNVESFQNGLAYVGLRFKKD